MDPVFLLAAALTGLAGAGHCAGMCGGIAGAFAHASGGARPLPSTLAYSGGRLTTYSLFGVIAGGLAALAAPADVGLAMAIGRTLAGLVLLLVALYLLDLVLWIKVLESGGSGAWRLIAPVLRKLLPANTLPRAWALGMLWGVMPCGLVYGALLYATTSGSAVAGGLTMLAFGVGTLPAVLGLGLAGRWLSTHAGRLRYWSGLLMLAYAVWTLLSTWIALPEILAGTCRSPGDVLGVVLNVLTHVN